MACEGIPIDYRQLVEGRWRLGLSRSEVLRRLLAEDIDMSPSSLSRYERGLRNPSPQVLSALCRVLALDAETLIIGFQGDAA